jgi:hypothetical protein
MYTYQELFNLRVVENETEVPTAGPKNDEHDVLKCISRTKMSRTKRHGHRSVQEMLPGLAKRFSTPFFFSF